MRLRVVLLEKGFDILQEVRSRLDEDCCVISQSFPKVEVQLGANVKVSKTFEVMEAIQRSCSAVRDWEICHTR